MNCGGASSGLCSRHVVTGYRIGQHSGPRSGHLRFAQALGKPVDARCARPARLGGTGNRRSALMTLTGARWELPPTDHATSVRHRADLGPDQARTPHLGPAPAQGPCRLRTTSGGFDPASDQQWAGWHTASRSQLVHHPPAAPPQHAAEDLARQERTSPLSPVGTQPPSPQAASCV
jgi:hypothetical protein